MTRRGRHARAPGVRMRVAGGSACAGSRCQRRTAAVSIFSDHRLTVGTVAWVVPEGRPTLPRLSVQAHRGARFLADNGRGSAVLLSVSTGQGFARLYTLILNTQISVNLIVYCKNLVNIITSAIRLLRAVTSGSLEIMSRFESAALVTCTAAVRNERECSATCTS